MKKYNNEPIGFEALLPNEFVELLHSNSPTHDEPASPVDYPLDEYELAMAA